MISFVLLGLAAIAAQDPTPSVDVALLYQAPATCPDARDFWAELRNRFVSARRVNPPGDWRVSVVISETEGRFVGRLRVSGGGLGNSGREIESPSCEEVVSALALISALVLTEFSTPTDKPARTPSIPRPWSPPPDPRSTRGWRWSVGAQAAVVLGVVPGAAFSAPIFSELTDHSKPWGASARIAFHWARGREDLDGAGADFTWLTGELQACPWAWTIHRARFTPCVSLSAGALRAQPYGVDNQASQTRPWIAPGALARLQMYPGGWEALFLELEAAGSVPLIRDRFYFAPGSELHQASPVSGRLAIGVGLTFW